MAQLLRIILFTILGASTCTALTEMSPPGATNRVRRGPEDNWPTLYPSSLYIVGGVYSSRTNGVFTVSDTTYNDRPVYKGGNNDAWSIYYRVSGYAANKWVLDFNEVSEEWSGTVAISETLSFAT